MGPDIFLVITVASEPGMTDNFLDAFEGANPVIRIFSEKAFDKGLDLFGDVGRLGEFGFRVENGEEDVFLFGGVERRPAKK